MFASLLLARHPLCFINSKNKRLKGAGWKVSERLGKALSFYTCVLSISVTGSRAGDTLLMLTGGLPISTAVMVFTYDIAIQGPFPGAAKGSLFWSVNLLSLLCLPEETVWESGYDTEIISFQICLLEAKQNLSSVHMIVNLQYHSKVTFASLFLKNTFLENSAWIDYFLFYRINYLFGLLGVLLEAHNGQMTRLRSLTDGDSLISLDPGQHSEWLSINSIKRLLFPLDAQSNIKYN